MSIEAMRYALAALEWNLPVIEDYGHKEQLNRQRKAITAIKQARSAPVQPMALHTMAKRRVFDAIRGAYDLGYNDARNAQAIPGDSALGYKGRDVEADHGNALMHALERYTTPPAQTAVPLSDEQIESLWDHGMYVHCSGITALRAITRAIEAAHGITGEQA